MRGRPRSRARATHFNPLGKKHGLENPEGAHGGDLPDLEADASGRTEYVAVTDRMTLGTGPTSIFDTDGSAVVIHEKPDDQRTDPSGNSGERVAVRPAGGGPDQRLRPPALGARVPRRVAAPGACARRPFADRGGACRAEGDAARLPVTAGEA